jgi:hypothetical protein
MTFSEGGSFEGGRVRSHRGAVAGGGIGLAIVAFLIYQFTGVDVGPAVEVLEGAGGTGGAGQGQDTTIGACSAEEANTQRDCRLSATLQSLDAYWADTLSAEGVEFTEPPATEFTGGVATGCGQASSSTGPFYCPPDQGIYLDLGFFDLLQSRFGASGGPLAEMYVIAHEYGHHIQNITGRMDGIDSQDTGPESDGVRLELQADCYAGMWTGDAASRVDPDTGVTFLEPITDEELDDALSAAEAVGDDHIQEQSGGGVNPDVWTHGSSEQRRNWFVTGYNEGTLAACDTFSAQSL